MSESLSALKYHQLTKHSVASVQGSPHYLEWDNQPLPFKIYTTLAAMPLPTDFDSSPDERLDLRALARLLFYTAGITHTKEFPNGQRHHFRAAACTGALYHLDAYAVCAPLDGLEAGVYHFSPHDFALRCLRSGDYRHTVIAASGGYAAIADAPVTLIFVSTPWRNAWKYQSRAYRHCYWDSGTMLANLLAVSHASIPATIVTGFVDDAVDQLLGLDRQRELAIAWVGLGQGASAPPPPSSAAPLSYEVAPLSRHEVDYPAIRAVHTASSMAAVEDVQSWQRRAFRRPLPAPQGTIVPLPAESPVVRSVEETIRRRGSARQFSQQAISFAELSRILRSASPPIASDFSLPGDGAENSSAELNDLYLIVNAVDGLAAGSYVYRPDLDALELLELGDFRKAAGYLDLGQELAADAAVNFYSLCDLRLIVDRLGERGYRAASLEAAIVGGRIYLAAYALGLGATGLTFFDDDVTTFFSPHGGGKGVMFLTAVGQPQRRRQG